jgi:PAS domain S-box-containing protein
MEDRCRAAVAEETPDRYERLYSMLLDSIPCSVLLVDQDVRIGSANRNFLDKSQRTLANTIGQRLEKVLPEVILDKLDISHRIRQVLETNHPVVGERMTYRAPGVPIRTYYYSILPFKWRGKIEGAILLMDDVTEQTRLSEEVRNVERFLASIVSSASDIILSTDRAGTILTWNEAAERLSGYPAEEALKRSFFEFCLDEDRKDISEVFASVQERKTAQIKECPFKTRQSSAIPISWAFSPLMASRNNAVGVVAVGRNLSERRKLETELFQAHKLAALGVMAGGIAHEIRNPLSICSSSAQFLLNKEESPEFQRDCVEKILKGVQRASSIIENLLKYSHPSSTTERVRLDLVSLIHETLTLVMSLAKVQQIETSVSSSAPAVEVEGVSTLLQQVFMNLFLNAINAMPEGGTLNIRISATKAEAVIQVSDTGCGITKDGLERVFDPFYTTSTIGTGTGLGLFFCYSIVKQHGGAIEVESAQDKGSTFTVRLPLRGRA